MTQLTKMDMESTRKYCEYRRGQDKKQWTIISLYSLVALVLMIVISVVFKDRIDQKIALLLIVVSCLLLVASIILTTIQMKKWKNAQGVPYEYAVITVVLDEKQEAERENGEKITFKLENGNVHKDGAKEVLVYIPETKSTYVEKMEKCKELGVL